MCVCYNENCSINFYRRHFLFLLCFVSFDKYSKMAPRRKCIFNADLQKEFPFMKIGATPSEVKCEICQCTLNIGSSGRSEITSHIASIKHVRKLNARCTSQKVTAYFPSIDDHKTSACEGVWAYHTVHANHSFNSSECASKIFRTCFEIKKFHCSRTKCEAIVTNVLGPYAVNEVKNEMANVKFLNIATDASNHGNVKMMPVLVRYFLPTIGVRVRLLDFSF